MSKEPFLESAAWVNSIKPRFAFGITGNLPDVLNLYDVAYSTSIGYMGETYIYPSIFAYDNISEERTTEYNLAVDWVLFNNRITDQFDYYNQRTRYLLMGDRLSTLLGSSSEYGNFSTVKKSGVEFGITAVIMEG